MENTETTELDVLNNLVSMYRNQVTDSYLFLSSGIRLLNQYERSTSSMINLLVEQRRPQRRSSQTQPLRAESRNLINYLRSTRPQGRTNNPGRTDDNANNLLNTIDNLMQSLTVDIESLTPVIVAPTETQINNATELVQYGSIESPLNNRCPITLVDFGENDTIRQIIPCGHCFNNRALLRWFTTNYRCPVCRTDIREYSPLNIIRNPYSNREQSSNPEQQSRSQP